MKKILGIAILGLLYCNLGFAEIIFKNCNLSPNTGMTDFYVSLEKNEIEIRDEAGDIRIFAIDDNQSSVLTATRLIAWPSMSDWNEATKHQQNLFVNEINRTIDERYLLNYNTGYVKQVFTTHPGADRETVENLKQGKPYLEVKCKVVNSYQKEKTKEKVVSTQTNNNTSSSNQSNLISISNYSKKQKKLYNKYMKTPEIELCIRYLNNYGWFDDQTVRYTAIHNRGLNCDNYQKLARDEDNRRNEIADAGKKLFDSTVDNAYGTTGNNGGNKRTHCTTTNVGGMIQVFCREY